ncbi:hypothetical protein PROAA_3260004 [Candidatus Propionivibrio aalborgensis]|uniref:Uncharacterized protein n=2 Tax=Candidatus Propionivibrio aalborgensis TaxID=1860101 RepID=A0A1A8XXX7_9RHOO|nr:hypothetical protein PROAA_3260004 [Candidatus Propionivibrio aalborgensis]
MLCGFQKRNRKNMGLRGGVREVDLLWLPGSVCGLFRNPFDAALRSQVLRRPLSQPMLRLVGLWQEFQQASIAVKRLGENERKRVSVQAHMNAVNVMP